MGTRRTVSKGGGPPDGGQQQERPPYEGRKKALDDPLEEFGMPMNPEAEKAVLGAVLLDNMAFADAASVLKAEDFAVDAHRRIFERMGSLVELHKPIDFTILTEALLATKELDVVGGVTYLSSLTDGLPRAVNTEHYARIVKDKSLRRRIIHTAHNIVQEGLDPKFESGEGPSFLDRVQSSFFEIEAANKKNEPVHIGDIVGNLNFDASATEMGLPTGFGRIDDITRGMHPGDYIIVAARPGMGKAQPLSAKLMTPDGWKRMGDMRVGDLVYGAEGQAAPVTGVFPQGRKKVFRVEFSDGFSTQCCEEHLWFVRHKRDRVGSVLALKDLSPHRRYWVPTTQPVEFPVGDPLPMDPYLMGLFLGDGKLGSGSIMFFKPEMDLQSRVAELLPQGDITVPVKGGCRIIKGPRRGGKPSLTKCILHKFGLLCGSLKKFVPPAYLTASVEDRFKLLRGLMDTDGNVVESGQSLEYSTSSGRLAKDVVFLVQSLGGIVSTRIKVPTFTYRGKRKVGANSHRMNIWFPHAETPVSSVKHLAKWKVRAGSRFLHRAIESIKPSGWAECQCISVGNSSQTYLTDNFIVTHNTSYLLDVVRYLAMVEKVPCLIFSLEMTKEALSTRMICAEAHIDSHKYRSGFLGKDDYRRIADVRAQIATAPIFIDEASGLTLPEMWSKVNRFKMRHKIRFVGLDYLQLMTPPKAENRNQEVSILSRGMKQMALKLDLVNTTLSQLSRATETRNAREPRPMLSDLRDSGGLEQDADLVAFLYRAEYYMKMRGREVPEDMKGIAEYIIAKQRQGPVGVIKLAFLDKYSSFGSLAEQQDLY